MLCQPYQRLPAFVLLLWEAGQLLMRCRCFSHIHNQEDDRVRELVRLYGTKKWSLIASKLEGRLGKQCRERWYNHLDPEIKKEPWTDEEDRLVIELHAKLGNRWAEIAKHLDGRYGYHHAVSHTP